MLCAISGQPPEIPVVSKKSGHVFEERLIMAFVSENGKDPINGEELAEEDLVRIKQNPRAAIPRPSELNSIPALLSSLQNEYDAVMLEMFSVKRSYDNIRQELAHTLYANDSAHRVIARLISERDEAIAALMSIKSSLGHNGISNGKIDDTSMTEATATVTDPRSIPSTSTAESSYVSAINSANEKLSSNRKAKMKRKTSSYLTPAIVKSHDQQRSAHKLVASEDDEEFTDMDISLDGSIYIIGSSKGNVYLGTNASTTTIGSHSSQIIRVAFAKNLIGVEHGDSKYDPPLFAASADLNSIIIWHADRKTFSQKHSISTTSEIVGMSFHPTANFLVLAFKDGSFAMYNIESNEQVLQIKTSEVFSSLDLHPDGILLGIGTLRSGVIIYDLRNGQESARFDEEIKECNVKSISFSENGYYMAVGMQSKQNVYDLRKMKQIFSNVNVNGSLVKFDPSGQFLAVSTSEEINIHQSKSFDLIKQLKDERKLNSIQWSWQTGNLFALRESQGVEEYLFFNQ